MNEKLQTTIDGILNALQIGIQKYGSQALDTAIRIKQIDSFYNLLGGLLLLILVLLAMFRIVLPTLQGRAFFLTLEMRQRVEEIRERYADGLNSTRYRGTLNDDLRRAQAPEDLHVITAGILGVLIFISLTPLAVLLINPWNWIGLFSPQLALAHDIYLRLMP